VLVGQHKGHLVCNNRATAVPKGSLLGHSAETKKAKSGSKMNETAE